MYASLPKVDYLKVKKRNTNLAISVKGKILPDENGKLCAKLFVGEDIFSKIKNNQELTFSGSAFGSKIYKGKISKIGEVVNGENSANKNGISKSSAEHLFTSGADVITTGNHAFRRRDVYPEFERNEFLLRPANYP
ncbi:MAG: YmdB family metallophosphoesterase, partial [Clostridia bacterium]|nr:YmdB family metallophosphoesterase [Clostridia bacterium]